jgi:hypothetical protein
VIEWRYDMENAPRDGRMVYVKREYEGQIIKEGWAVWGVNSADAPMRQWGQGGLGGPIPPDNAYADKPRWLNPDRRFSFPTPTAWASINAPEGEG